MVEYGASENVTPVLMSLHAKACLHYATVTAIVTDGYTAHYGGLYRHLSTA